MITFAYPKLLYLLLLVPLFVLLFVWARWMRKRKLAKFGMLKNFSSLMPDVSPYKPPLKITLRLIALTMIIVALCRPWGGISNRNTTRQGIEVMICVDASNSMLASSSDSPDGIDRMRMTKVALEKLIDRLGNDRVGLIVYAGDAYTLVPVTSDYTSAKMFLNSIDPSMIENQGTNIASAVELATKSFSDTKNVGKAIVILTDAEELEDPEAVYASVKQAASDKIQVDVIGVGSGKPMTIPTASGPMINPETGDFVQTALNEDLALDIAKDGKGIYVNAANKDAVNELDKKLDQLQKVSLESSFLAVHDELFMIFLWIAVAMIVADIFVLDRKISWLDRITFFKKESSNNHKVD